MKEKLRFLGLDVHAETIAVAIAEPDGEVRSLGTIANRAEPIRKLVKKLGRAEKLRACPTEGLRGQATCFTSIPALQGPPDYIRAYSPVVGDGT